jgi:hypothetical protein
LRFLKKKLKTDLLSKFAVSGYGYQILLKRTHFTKSVNKFYFPVAKYGYHLDMPAVPVKNIFCIWEKISSSVRFHLFIVSVTRVVTSMATDGVNAFVLPHTPAVHLPRRMALLFSVSE